mgnify:CR=1 FL=1
MRFEVTNNMSELEDKLYILAQEAQVAPGVVIKEETKALVKNIMQLTPPATQAQGRKAVLKDMRKVAIPITSALSTDASLDVVSDDESTPWRKRLAKLIRKRDTSGIEEMLRHARSKFWRNRTALGSQGALAQEHLRSRNRRGRTTKRLNIAFKKDWQAHVKNIQSRVGWVKSGWVAVATKAGLATPSWLRGLSAVSGCADANWGKGPFVYAVARNVKIPNYQRVVDGAINNRVRATATKIERLITGKAVNLGFKVVNAK